MFSKKFGESLPQIKERPVAGVEALNATRLVFTRPAKDIFNNLGGFATCLPLLASRIKHLPNTVEQEYVARC